MSLALVIRSFIELAAIVLLIVGFINEKKVIAFEAKLARAIRIHLRNRRVRKQRELAAAHCAAQTRAPADAPARATVITVAKGTKGIYRVA